MKYFFSYSRHDGDFVKGLAQDLKAKNMNVWLDQIDIPPGVKWDTCIEQALNESVGMILVLSTSSVASDNVMDEVNYAISKNKHVIPLLLDDCDVPFRLARIQQIDFKSDHQKGIESIISTINALNASGQNTVVTPKIATPQPPPPPPAPRPVNNNAGNPPPAAKSGKLKYILIGAAVVVVLLIALSFFIPDGGKPADGSTSAASTATPSSLALEGTIVNNDKDSVAYNITGSKIVFTIRSMNDPSIYVDVNQNKLSDSKYDRTYSLAGDNTICVSAINKNDCNLSSYSDVKHTKKMNIFTIPLEELSVQKDSIYVSFSFWDNIDGFTD